MRDATRGRRIADIPDVTAAVDEARRRWRIGNDSGEGFAWDIYQRASILCVAPCGMIVYALPDGSEVVVCRSNGLWGVEVSPATSAAE